MAYKTNRNKQVGCFYARQWKFDEKHLSQLSYHAKVGAISFFKALKQLEPREVELLAERYYKSEQRAKYSNAFEDYQTVIPVKINVMAEKLGIPEGKLKKEIYRIEEKIGEIILGIKEDVDQEEAKKHIRKLEEVTLNKLGNYHERQILSAAFDEIAKYRETIKIIDLDLS